MPSEGRIQSLGKYLTSHAQALAGLPGPEQLASSSPEEPPSRRKQLHILYLLNDLLHHVTYHDPISSRRPNIPETLSKTLRDIIAAASSHELDLFPKHHKRIKELIEIWDAKKYLSPEHIHILRDTSSQVSATVHHEGLSAKSQIKILDDQGQTYSEEPFILPSSHGDLSTPFYDLPAGNMMPHIIPNSTTSINPQSMKPLQFVIGPADPKLIAAVEDLLTVSQSHVHSQWVSIENGEKDLDQLGQIIVRDEVTGDVLDSEAYYGWSREFCRNMKRASSGIRGWDDGTKRSQSLEGSRSPRKRRRYSHSSSGNSGSREASVSRSRSKSSDRKPAADGLGRQALTNPGTAPLQSARYGQVPGRSPGNNLSKPPLPPPPFIQGFPLGPGGIPIPPRPLNYNGPWPPPPPLPHTNTAGMLPNHFQTSNEHGTAPGFRNQQASPQAYRQDQITVAPPQPYNSFPEFSNGSGRRK